MKGDEQAIIVIQNRVKTLILLLVLSIVILFFAVELLRMRQLRIEIPHPVFIYIVALLSGSFYFILSGIYGLITKRPVFIINKAGIIDRSFLSGTGLIKWEEIDTINIYRSMRQAYIGIFLNNTKIFYAKKWPLARFAAFINMQLGLAPINISQSLLPLPLDMFLAQMQKLQDKNNVRYILVKHDIPHSKVRPISFILKISFLIIVAISIIFLGSSFFVISSRPFILQAHTHNGLSFFSSTNLGGYGFFIDKKWMNVQNKKMMSRFKGDIRNDIFFILKDKPCELWLSIDRNSKLPLDVQTQNSKKRILKELPATRANIVRFIDEKVVIAGFERILSSVYLENAQILSILSTQSGDLSITGYLAYDSKNLELIRDLASVLESLKKLIPAK